jgi:hypothetical protein
MEKDEDKEKKKQVLFVSQDYILPFRPLELNHEYSVLSANQYRQWNISF